MKNILGNKKSILLAIFIVILFVCLDLIIIHVMGGMIISTCLSLLVSSILLLDFILSFDIKKKPFFFCYKDQCYKKLKSFNPAELRVFMEDIKNFKVYNTLTFCNVISIIITFLTYLMNNFIKEKGKALYSDMLVSGYIVIFTSLLLYFFTKKSIKDFRIEYYKHFDDEGNEINKK